MECKTTSTRRRRSGAFTFVELMVASTIATVVMAAVATLMYFTARSCASLGNYVEMDQKSRIAIDRMSLEIRQADSLWSYTPNQLIFVKGGMTNLSYTYFPDCGTLVRSNAGLSEILLTGCSNLTFTIFGRATLSNAFDQFPTATAANAKLIKVDWTCSRQVPGQPVDTESVESAKIVIRKQGI